MKIYQRNIISINLFLLSYNISHFNQLLLTKKKYFLFPNRCILDIGYYLVFSKSIRVSFVFVFNNKIHVKLVYGMHSFLISNLVLQLLSTMALFGIYKDSLMPVALWMNNTDAKEGKVPLLLFLIPDIKYSSFISSKTRLR